MEKSFCKKSRAKELNQEIKDLPTVPFSASNQEEIINHELYVADPGQQCGDFCQSKGNLTNSCKKEA